MSATKERTFTQALDDLASNLFNLFLLTILGIGVVAFWFDRDVGFWDMAATVVTIKLAVQPLRGAR